MTINFKEIRISSISAQFMNSFHKSVNSLDIRSRFGANILFSLQNAGISQEIDPFLVQKIEMYVKEGYQQLMR